MVTALNVLSIDGLRCLVVPRVGERMVVVNTRLELVSVRKEVTPARQLGSGSCASSLELPMYTSQGKMIAVSGQASPVCHRRSNKVYNLGEMKASSIEETTMHRKDALNVQISRLLRRQRYA